MFSNKPDRPKKSHHNSSSSKSHSHSKSKTDRKPKEIGTNGILGPVFTFLFVIVEFSICDDSASQNPDIWGNPRPPKSPASYNTANEKPSSVWRYRDGIVELASDYKWVRPDPSREGGIFRLTPHTMLPGDAPLIVYETFSVFNCWRFLPCLYTAADSSVVDVESSMEYRWDQLAFAHPGPESFTAEYPPRLVTRIGLAQRHVEAVNPGWMPDLVARSHAAVAPGGPVSYGLGGYVGVILGLMALSQKQRRADRIFQHWTGGNWQPGSREASADPHPAGPPRGVLVQVCLDDAYPEASTHEKIMHFELNDVMVFG